MANRCPKKYGQVRTMSVSSIELYVTPAPSSNPQTRHMKSHERGDLVGQFSACSTGSSLGSCFPLQAPVEMCTDIHSADVGEPPPLVSFKGKETNHFRGSPIETTDPDIHPDDPDGSPCEAWEATKMPPLMTAKAFPVLLHGV